MSKIRYLIDENTTRVIADQLLRLRPEIDILVVGDDFAPARGTLDPEILVWMEQKGYSLITRNRKSMPVHLTDHLHAGCHIPGIFTFTHGAPLGLVIETLLLVWEASEPGEYQDQIVFIPF